MFACRRIAVVLALACLPIAISVPSSFADTNVGPVTVVNGGIGTPDPTTPYVPASGLVKDHALLEANSAAAVADLVASGATQSAPAVTDAALTPVSASSPDVATSGVPASWHTYLAPQYQQGAMWCAPASGRNILTSDGFNVSQASMAAGMKTSNTAGTYLSNMPAPMNRYFDWFIADNDVSSAAHLLNRVVDDTYYVGTALALGVQGSVLPWWRQHNFSGLHVIAAYGYYTNGGGGLDLADPLNQPWAGYHNLAATQTYAAMNGNANGMVW